MKFLADLMGWGDQVDIMPFAMAALADRPDVQGIDARQLCELADTHCQRRLPKNVFPPLPNDVVDFLIYRVVRRAMMAHRITQVDDPDVRKLRPYVDFIFDSVLCEEAAKLTGRFHPVGSLQVLPLPGCKHGNCSCHYTTKSRRDMERAGRFGIDGEPLPLPTSQATPSA